MHTNYYFHIHTSIYLQNQNIKIEEENIHLH